MNIFALFSLFSAALYLYHDFLTYLCHLLNKFNTKFIFFFEGLDIRLVHIPGETDDQIGVWIPSMEAFLCADDVYRAFPNLYAIRGTPHRDPVKWAHSIDKIRALRPQYLVPSHTHPITWMKKKFMTF